MIKQIAQLVWIALLLVISIPVAAKNLHCATTHYPPFATFDVNNRQFTGSDLTLINQLATHFEWQVSVDNLPWARLNKIISGKLYDCFFALADQPQRRLHLSYTNIPLHVTRYAMFRRSGETGPIQTVGHLRGMALTPSMIDKHALQAAVSLRFTSNEQLLEMLMLGRIDGFVTNSEVGQFVIANAKAGQWVTMDIDQGYELPVYLAFRENVVDIEKVNKVLSDITGQHRNVTIKTQ